MNYILLKNCKEILTVRENASDFIGLEKGKSILIRGERIEKIDEYKNVKEYLNSSDCKVIDCSQRVVMPGYVDCHTHLIFGGSRVDEYTASLTMNAENVKKTVGKIGLEASIFSTKTASDEDLINSSLKKLYRMLGQGTTTVEIKSGYGIDRDTEVRLLQLIRKIGLMTPQTILSTYLGAHYYDQVMGKQLYMDYMIKEVMPIIQSEKLADFIDIWCDEGYYTAEDSYKILSEGMKHGMIPTMHTECYSSIGGAKIAAKLQAANVGHLNYVTREDIKLLKAAHVVGVLLPGTDFSVNHKCPFNPRPMIENGLTIAIATNLNPGNWIESMSLAMALACRNHGMTEKEAIRAATLGGAKALKIDKNYGSLEPGKYADIQILNTDTYKNCIYKLGVNEVEMVIKKGKIIEVGCLYE